MNTTQITITFVYIIGFYLYIFTIGSATLIALRAKYNRALAILTGLMEVFALTEIIAMPFMQTQGDYQTFFIIFISLLIFILVLSLNFLVHNNKLDVYRIELNKYTNISVIILLILIVLQIAVPTAFSRFDGDDAFYIAVSTSIQTTGKIFINNPSIGLDEFIFPLNYRFTAYEILITVLSNLTYFDPVVFYHTLCPLTFIPIYYLAFLALAKAIFPKNYQRRKQYLFLFIICLLTLFDNYSNYLASSFELLKAWMGKSSTINLCYTTFLAYFIYLIRDEIKERKNTKYFILVAISLIAGACTSAVGLYLIPVAYFCLFISSLLVLYVKDFKNKFREILNFILKAFLSALPSFLLLLGFYIMLRTNNGFYQLNSFESERTWLEDASLIFGGNIFLAGFYLISVLYFAFFGNKIMRIIFFINPIILLLTFVNPLLHDIVGRYLTSLPLYWRFFWLFPYFITIACFIVKSLENFNFEFKKFRFIVFIPLILICLPVNFALNETKYYQVENSAKIPSDIAPTVQTILSNVNTQNPNNLYLLSLPSYNIYLRQYTGKIALVMPRLNFVEEAYYYAGKKKEFEVLKHLFTYDEENIIKGLQEKFKLEDLELLNISLIIAPEAHTELSDTYTEIILNNEDYLYIRNDIYRFKT